MPRGAALSLCLAVALLGAVPLAQSHPLRLSLTEIEYESDSRLLSISLRLFLMDVREALLFDPDNAELAFCQTDESPDAERLLLEYLDEFFYVRANGEPVELEIKEKKLNGVGDNVALAVLIEHYPAQPLRTLEVKNTVFTDLFSDQSNIVYVHVDDDSKSLMLNVETPVHELTY